MIRSSIFDMSKIIGNLSSLRKYTASFAEMTSLDDFLQGGKQLKLCSIMRFEKSQILIKLRCRANHTAVIQLTGRGNQK